MVSTSTGLRNIHSSAATLKLLREDKFKDKERKLKTLAAAASLFKNIESILRDEATDGLLLLANAPLGETSSVQRS